jgi:hypothetical protein
MNDLFNSYDNERQETTIIVKNPPPQVTSSDSLETQQEQKPSAQLEQISV